MQIGTRASLVVVLLLVLTSAAGCAAGPGGLLKQYEYEEEIYLSLDGSARVHVNASVPALVALRGADLDTRPNARLDRARVRALYQSPVSDVTRVSTWRRQGRRFVQVRIDVADIRQLSRVTPFAWSAYELDERDGLVVYRQVLGDPARRDVPEARWRGDELVAVRLHLPARIRYHNAGAGNLKRGNILVWEQSLADRRAGRSLQIEARMDRQSILFSTLKLFAISGAIAVAVLASIIVLVVRSGRRRTAGVSRP